jgi:hypothetical protein
MPDAQYTRNLRMGCNEADAVRAAQLQSHSRTGLTVNEDLLSRACEIICLIVRLQTDNYYFEGGC